MTTPEGEGVFRVDAREVGHTEVALSRRATPGKMLASPSRQSPPPEASDACVSRSASTPSTWSQFRGILEVRIIQGKGTGALRRTVHAVLEKMPEVASFELDGGDAGGWGATVVALWPREA